MNSKQRLSGEEGTLTSIESLCVSSIKTGSVPTYLYSADLCERLETLGYLVEKDTIKCEAGVFRRYTLTEKGRVYFTEQRAFV